MKNLGNSRSEEDSSYAEDVPSNVNHPQTLAFAVDASQMGLWDWNMVSDSLFIDERWADMLGYTVAELEPVTIDTFTNLSKESDRTRISDSVEDHDRGDSEFYEVEFRLKHKDGHWVWIRARGLIVERLEDGRRSRMTGVHEDISVARARTRDLKITTAQLEEAQRLSGIGSWFWDLESDETTWSDALFEMQGFDPTEPVPSSRRQAAVFTKESWSRLSRAIELMSSTGESYSLELEMDPSASPMRWMLARGDAVKNEVGEIVCLVGIAQDISERKESEERLRLMALQDGLSELGNRKALFLFLDAELARAEVKNRAVACLAIDLDHFKSINDSFGHDAGDSVIRIAAARFSRATRKNDAAFRPGGDEFVIVLDSARPAAGAHAVADRLLQAFREPIGFESREVLVTVSIGIAFSEPGMSAAQLFKNADLALYEAKDQGRNQIAVYSSELGERARERGTAGGRHRIDD
jgi:diguanylate cyclase (GGDEF)-like protein/PAS domain S-box-containing protein